MEKRILVTQLGLPQGSLHFGNFLHRLQFLPATLVHRPGATSTIQLRSPLLWFAHPPLINKLPKNLWPELRGLSFDRLNQLCFFESGQKRLWQVPLHAALYKFPITITATINRWYQDQIGFRKSLPTDAESLLMDRMVTAGCSWESTGETPLGRTTTTKNGKKKYKKKNKRKTRRSTKRRTRMGRKWKKNKKNKKQEVMQEQEQEEQEQGREQEEAQKEE